MNDDQPTLTKRAPMRLLDKRMIPRYLFWLACVATLFALFYGVENWRGRRAWEKCRRELEAKGEVLDWNAYIPAPVSDDQNVFKAPRIAEWFARDYGSQFGPSKPPQSSTTGASFNLAPDWNAKRAPVLLVEVEVVRPDEPVPSAKSDAVLRFDDPAARDQAAQLVRERIGPCARDIWGNVVIARPLDEIHPLHLVLQVNTAPTLPALTEFLSPSERPSQPGFTPGRGFLQVERVGSLGFDVSLEPSVHGAAEYLAASQPAVPDLDLLRKALERPCVRMDGDYQRPFAQPIPNFVRLRTVAQMLSQRAQCYLLLGQPEAAWRELALVREMCRLLGESPPGKPTTLVEVMIDVAITGLYTQEIADGLRLHAWREPELAAMQQQLKDVNLLPLFREAINGERAGVCRLFEITLLAGQRKWPFPGYESQSLWDKLKNPRVLFSGVMPRGWILQNMRALAVRDQLFAGSLDIPNNLVLPRTADGISNQLHVVLSRFTPYTFMGEAAVPNWLRALQTLARNQTLVSEAYVACGLERYRLAHGQYPDTLEALVPQFAEKLPHDLIGGQPLKYHRKADGQFLLYSVGWNGHDDGGVLGKTTAEGDWVWQLPPS
jgi:hypothetical protein